MLRPDLVTQNFFQETAKSITCHSKMCLRTRLRVQRERVPVTQQGENIPYFKNKMMSAQPRSLRGTRSSNKKRDLEKDLKKLVCLER